MHDIEIWEKKLDWIAEVGGMALLNTHPDYMNFGDGPSQMDEYPVERLCTFLKYVQSNYEGFFWHALPREVARFWTAQMEGKRAV